MPSKLPPGAHGYTHIHEGPMGEPAKGPIWGTWIYRPEADRENQFPHFDSTDLYKVLERALDWWLEDPKREVWLQGSIVRHAKPTCWCGFEFEADWYSDRENIARWKVGKTGKFWQSNNLELCQDQDAAAEIREFINELKAIAKEAPSPT